MLTEMSAELFALLLFVMRNGERESVCRVESVEPRALAVSGGGLAFLCAFHIVHIHVLFSSPGTARSSNRPHHKKANFSTDKLK